VTQDDIDKYVLVDFERTLLAMCRAIAYLLPSGLHAKEARPMMRPPEDYYPAEQIIPMDERGRPLHTLFYTVTPQFYELMQKVSDSEKVASLT
jgi:small subunit ribosomal protein S9